MPLNPAEIETYIGPVQETVEYLNNSAAVSTPESAASYLHQHAALCHQLYDPNNPFALNTGHISLS
jgi:hypothetical protein